MQAELDGRGGPLQSHESQVPGPGDSFLPAGEAAALKLALLATEAERDRAKQQLSRCTSVTSRLSDLSKLSQLPK